MTKWLTRKRAAVSEPTSQLMVMITNILMTTRKTILVLQKNNETSSKMEKEYFEDYNGNKMTVVFHAVLAPHFKFEPNLGDKIYMRFGGEKFGDFQHNVVEVIHQR